MGDEGDSQTVDCYGGPGEVHKQEALVVLGSFLCAARQETDYRRPAQLVSENTG